MLKVYVVLHDVQINSHRPFWKESCHTGSSTLAQAPKFSEEAKSKVGSRLLFARQMEITCPMIGLCILFITSN